MPSEPKASGPAQRQMRAARDWRADLSRRTFSPECDNIFHCLIIKTLACKLLGALSSLFRDLWASKRMSRPSALVNAGGGIGFRLVAHGCGPAARPGQKFVAVGFGLVDDAFFVFLALRYILFESVNYFPGRMDILKLDSQHLMPAP